MEGEDDEEEDGEEEGEAEAQAPAWSPRWTQAGCPPSQLLGIVQSQELGTGRLQKP